MIRRNGKCIIPNVEYANTLFKRTLGLMFRRRIKNDYALFFSLEREAVCDVHMLFVPFDIDIVFLDIFCNVVKIDTLKSWAGRSKCFCSSFIECKNGTVDAHELKIGDNLSLK
jgi:uncharacterized membrane protein (UPF0127 family)